MLEWAGVCFGEEDTYRLGKSIKVSSFSTINLCDAHLSVVETSSHEWRRTHEIRR